MSLRMIFGRAGSGKTQYCLDAIKRYALDDPKGRFILLIPEQSSFITEKRIMEHMGEGSGLAVSVFSFRQLFNFVLLETGERFFPALTELEQNLIVRLILEERKRQLQIFGNAYKNPGFVRELSCLINEFRGYRIKPEQLSGGNGPEVFKSQSQRKLEDISMIYRDYMERITSRWIDASGELEQLSQMIEHSQYLRQAVVWLDGFHGFTPAEFQVILAMLAEDITVHITLTMEGGMEKSPMSEDAVFFPTWEMAKALESLALEHKWDLLDPIYMPSSQTGRFQQAPELCFLEAALSREEPAKGWTPEPVSLMIQNCANPREEIEFCAREIWRLVRDEGYRFRDILVLARDYKHYELSIRTIFNNHMIPFFEDWIRPLQYHPLVFFMRNLLELLDGSRSSRRHDAIFACLKTGLMDIALSEVDRLENYCMAHGIDYKDWEMDWAFEDRNTAARMNRIRKRVIEPLKRLRAGMKQGRGARAYTEAIWGYLKMIRMDWKCEDMRARALRQNRLEEAELHEAVWRNILTLLDTMVCLPGGEPLPPETYYQIFRTGLDQMDAAIVPQTLDQVLIGTLDRTRAPEVACVFILGVNEGVLPAKIPEDVLLTSQERAWLNEKGIHLAPNTEKKVFYESFLVYMALTRAGKLIRISYMRADMAGKGMAASPLIDDLNRIFPNIRHESDLPSGTALVSAPAATLAHLARNLQNEDPMWRYVFQWYQSRPEQTQVLSRLLAGLLIKPLPGQLDASLAGALYGRHIHTGVTRIERYAACPFAHFIDYGLGLAERRSYQLSPPDLGQFFHGALETFMLDLNREDRDLGSMDADEIVQRVYASVQNQLPLIQNEILLSSARYRALGRDLERIVRRAAQVLAEHDRRSAFRTLDVEVRFGQGEVLPGLRMDLSGDSTIWLKGRIDRIDLAAGGNEEETYVRIIDYKSGVISLNFWEVYYGLKMQLPVYMAVLLKTLPWRPGGIFYFSVKDPMIYKPGPIAKEALQKEIQKRLKMTGYLLKDPHVIRMMDEEISGYSDLIPAAMNQNDEIYNNNRFLLSETAFMDICTYCVQMTKNMAEAMTQGNIRAYPWKFKDKSACRFCLYKYICRFDTTIAGHVYRHLKPVGTVE
jgi:ATP-dependent helicase/nuclease subunit B